MKPPTATSSSQGQVVTVSTEQKLCWVEEQRARGQGTNAVPVSEGLQLSAGLLQGLLLENQNTEGLDPAGIVFLKSWPPRSSSLSATPSNRGMEEKKQLCPPLSLFYLCLSPHGAYSFSICSQEVSKARWAQGGARSCSPNLCQLI